MSRALLLAVVLAACGPKAADEPVVANTARDAGVVLAPGCPATFAAATGGCDPAVGSCAYAEGSCWCGVAQPCTGVDLGDEWDDDIPPTWQCTATPPDIRDDGCPGIQPSGACWQDAQVCSYGDCCFSELTCRNGAWEITGGGCPP